MEPDSPLDGAWDQELSQGWPANGCSHRSHRHGPDGAGQEAHLHSLVGCCHRRHSLHESFGRERRTESSRGCDEADRRQDVFHSERERLVGYRAIARVDPGLRNEVAREAILAGREVIRSDTIADFDNAIALFKKALRGGTQFGPGSCLSGHGGYRANPFQPRPQFPGARERRRLKERFSFLRDRPKRIGPGWSLLSGGKILRGARAEQLQTVEIGGLAGSTGDVSRHDPGYAGAAASSSGLARRGCRN